MTHVSLFSGIGGFDLAAKWCWGDEYVPLAHSDVEEFACKVYHRHFPESECLGDIKKIRWVEWLTRYAKSHTGHQEQEVPWQEQIPIARGGDRWIDSQNADGAILPITVDLLTGGFPCQPFSVAGKRKGKEDDRALWPEMFRAIREIRPRYIVGENVAGLISMGLDEVLSDLEGEGYATEAFVIPACATNAPHRRDRVWIVGNAARPRDSELGKSYRGKNRTGEGRPFLTDKSDSDAPDPERQGLEGGNPERAGRSGGRITEPVECFGWDHEGRPDWERDWYEVATAFCRVDDGLPRQLDRTARLKALGNAIVPQVAMEISRAIKAVDERGKP